MNNEDDTFDALKNPPTADELAFGRKAWVYCGQHLRPHLTGWCTVHNLEKVKLTATTEKEAYDECVSEGLILYKAGL